MMRLNMICVSHANIYVICLIPCLQRNLRALTLKCGAVAKRLMSWVGLAKPYVYKNSNCYLMCNGVFFYDE